MNIKASKLLKELINCFRTISTVTYRFNTIFNIMSTIAKGTKEFLQYLCFNWNKVKLGESLFSRWISWHLFDIMVERKEGVSYLLKIKITLYGSSWHEILIKMRRSCNSERVYSLSLIFGIDMRNMRNSHSNIVSCVFCFPSFPAKVNTVLSTPKISYLV